jgi:hypothetical protein
LVRIPAKFRSCPILGQRRISMFGPIFQSELVKRRELTNSFKRLEKVAMVLYKALQRSLTSLRCYL